MAIPLTILPGRHVLDTKPGTTILKSAHASRGRHHRHLRRARSLHVVPGQARRGHRAAAHHHGRAAAGRRAGARGLPALVPVAGDRAGDRPDRPPARRHHLPDPRRASGPAGAPAPVSIDAGIRKRAVTVALPKDEHQQTSDVEALVAAAGGTVEDVPAALLKSLPATLRDRDGLVTVTTFGRHVLAVEADDTALHKFGLAIDIGTTSVVTTLMELESGEQLAAVVEPQPPGGLRRRPDVAHRLRPVRRGQPPQAADPHHRPAQPAHRADHARVRRARQVDLQGGDRRQHLHAPPAPRHRSVLRGPGPVRAGGAPAPGPARARAVPEAVAGGAGLPAAAGGGLRGRRRGRGGAGHPPRRVPDPPHRGRHRHQRRGPAGLARAAVGLLGPRRPRARGRPDPPRHARGHRGHRPRRGRGGRPAPAHHRRRARAGALRLRPPGRGGRAARPGRARLDRPHRRGRPRPAARAPSARASRCAARSVWWCSRGWASTARSGRSR